MLDRVDNRCDSVMLDWLERRVDADRLNWLTAAANQVADMDDARLERALALAGRKVGKADLAPTDTELSDADAVRLGWSPHQWSLADVARAYILTVLAMEREGFGSRFRRLCQTADLASLIGLYRATPVLPYNADLDWQLGEGLRTSIGEIFEAIAHHNPVPAEAFSEHRWNHMVLKALFVDSSLPPIWGLDQCRNAALAATLVDHVHERRAAGRAVNHHVWRCIAPFATGEVLNEILPLSQSADPTARQVAALFLSESPDSKAAARLDTLPGERDAIAAGHLGWSAIPG
ncbi:EboA domain-containing protein [Pelagibacterium luteolum]|uniref:Uncharacterized protein n=1 Tax=Pelagibacterium luteolum TaxID=440168 RepID=A0A1G7SVB7_9HYPH|nr:EboA domain-containing protein [Pelagibacterium luteolum]SDG26734.1 hypothetical protein SAMN04487974_101737 [Pelagibacterium luteolum]